jgi:predicted DNA-binding transcriptional regulator YafY
MRIDRMLAITLMLLNRDRISARELADRFEVSVRTIYRDIESINMAGIPIISFSGNSGGFGIMENYRIDRQLLTIKDMLGILTALNGVNSALDDQNIDTAIEKIKNLIPKDKTEELNLRFEQIVIDLLPWEYPAKYKKMLKEIQQSIEGNKLLKIIYTNAKGIRSSRIIEPMTLLLKGYAWYVFAFCRLRNDYRIFRVSRISDIKPMQEIFTRRKESYKDHMEWNNYAEKILNLVLRFSPELRARVEEYFDESHIQMQQNGDMIVNVSYPEDEWVYSFILSYGEYVEVLEPPHIRDIIHEKARGIISKYNS